MGGSDSPSAERTRPDRNSEGLAPRQGVSLGILAGAGTLPAAVARAAQDAGHRPFIVAVVDNADKVVEQFPHVWVHIGEIGRMVSSFRGENCKVIVPVGGIRRPNLRRLKFDGGFVWNMPELLRLLKGGDDTVLRGVARFFEGKGFEVRGSHDVAPNLLAPAGLFSKGEPQSEDFTDIKLGFEIVKAIGPFDIGQAAVVARKRVLAVEAAEGTDAMIERCGPLNRRAVQARRGVLVKRPKPGQDLRLDLPAIGPRTVELAAAAGLAGIAVQAGYVLLADQQELVDKADRLGIFLYGMADNES